MYSRKLWSKRKENLEDFQSQRQDSKPESGNENNFSDLDILVAKRKGIRSCYSHPISNFVNYEHLSSFVLAFVTKSAGVEIPNTGRIQNGEKLSWKRCKLSRTTILGMLSKGPKTKFRLDVNESLL